MALVKALIINKESLKLNPLSVMEHVIPVMFNPPDYQLSKSANFAELKIPGLPESVFQYVGSGVQTLKMELFFDTTEHGLDVRLRTQPIVRLTDPDKTTYAPPRLLLLWG
ncbi:MAG: hypothetical protein WBC34_05240, partial [Thiofilum sp.]